jgi:hypothetical protein
MPCPHGVRSDQYADQEQREPRGECDPTRRAKTLRLHRDHVERRQHDREPTNEQRDRRDR